MLLQSSKIYEDIRREIRTLLANKYVWDNVLDIYAWYQCTRSSIAEGRLIFEYLSNLKKCSEITEDKKKLNSIVPKAKL